MEWWIGSWIFIACFAVAVVMGAVTQQSGFCTMGAVSDWINIGDKGRLGAWFLAIAVAVCGVSVLELTNVISVNETRPPYRTANFAWIRYLLGGFMFGVGMTLASGCTTKTLVRLGGGNMKSIVVLGIVGLFAYLMTQTNFFYFVFLSWMQYLTIDLTAFSISNQSLPALVGLQDSLIARIVIALVIALVFLKIALVFIKRTSGFTDNGNNIFAGIVIGLCVVAGWYISGGEYGQTWIEETEWLDQPPVGVAVQSYTFVNPMGEFLSFFAAPAMQRVTFGMVAALGVLVGAFLYSLFTRSIRLEWFSSRKDFVTHATGAALMGTGGVLAMGCTIGQGITGVSTLAIGAVITLISIILGAATTMKMLYYKMVYEEAGWLDIFITGWVDLKLMPAKMRKLDAL